MDYPKYEQLNYSGELPVIFHFDILPDVNGQCFDIYSHWHDAIEILFFKRGSAEIYSNTETVIANPGDIIVINSNSIHRINRISDTVKYYCMIIDKNYIDKMGFAVSDRQLDFKICDEAISVLYTSFSKAYHKRVSYSVQKLKGYLYLLLATLYEKYSSAQTLVSTGSSSDKIELCKKAITYIHDNYHQSFTIDTLASHCHISKFYFCRIFKDVTGVTVINFVNSFRCMKAKELLLSGEYSISEISQMCGFESPSYFTKIFKKIHSTTPTSFKKQ